MLGSSTHLFTFRLKMEDLVNVNLHYSSCEGNGQSISSASFLSLPRSLIPDALEYIRDFLEG